MAHSESSTMEKMLLSRYNVKSLTGVTKLLGDIHTLREKRFQGSDSTFLSCILVDFERLQHKAKLTGRQQEALWFHYELDLPQSEVAKEMGISQQAVSKHIDNAIAKIVIAAKEEESME